MDIMKFHQNNLEFLISSFIHEQTPISIVCVGHLIQSDVKFNSTITFDITEYALETLICNSNGIAFSTRYLQEDEPITLQVSIPYYAIIQVNIQENQLVAYINPIAGVKATEFNDSNYNYEELSFMKFKHNTVNSKFFKLYNKGN